MRPRTAGHEAEGRNTQGGRETARALFHRHLFLLKGWLSLKKGEGWRRREGGQRHPVFAM
ncbi:hypothetical protein GmRootV77_08990 [Variovorax sp. V77]